MYKISMQKVIKILRVIREDPNNGINHVSRMEDSLFEKCKFSPNKPQAQCNPNQNCNKCTQNGKKKKKLQQVIALGQMWQVSMERKGLRDSQDTTEDNQGLALVDIKPHNH